MSRPLERRIGHLDMDAFFAAVEQLDEPGYRGKPVIIGGLGPRSVVSTASYEARVYGVHSAMPMAVARKRCPSGIFLRPRFLRYKEISEQFRSILRAYSSVVETVSVDEAFFDLSRHGSSFAAARSVAEEIKERVQSETLLTCSVGVAANRFMSKLASELDKPNGFLVIEPGQEQGVLDPLPVGRIWGVGRVTERRLLGLGLLRVRDVRTASPELMVREFGSMGLRLQQLSRGEDDTSLCGEAESKSISREVTYAFDLTDPVEIDQEVRRMACDVAEQLQDEGYLARTVRIKIRYPDFHTITRQARVSVGIDSGRLIETIASHLLHDRVILDDRGVRLIGVGVGNLGETTARQLSLF